MIVQKVQRFSIGAEVLSRCRGLLSCGGRCRGAEVQSVVVQSWCRGAKV
jgi:hypothetical protein